MGLNASEEPAGFDLLFDRSHICVRPDGGFSARRHVCSAACGRGLDESSEREPVLRPNAAVQRDGFRFLERVSDLEHHTRRHRQRERERPVHHSRAIPTQQTITVKATSVADTTKSASATITLIPLTISMSPASANLYGGQTAQFSASIQKSNNTGVTWTLSLIHI